MSAAGAAETRWNSYRTVLWMGDTAYRHPAQLPQFFSLAREMGIDSITLSPGVDIRTAVTNGLGFYVENVVNRGLCLKFNSSVKDWDAFVTGWAKTGRPASALVRDYSLDDPKWLAWAEREVIDAVRASSAGAPFAYDLRDELSVTHSANPFDYDFSPATLAGFRTWLAEQYGNLDALNQAWETGFPSWEAVVPFTTDQIKNRMAGGAAFPPANPDWHAVQELRFRSRAEQGSLTRWNFSPWADFRTYMDLSLARVLGSLRDAAHRTDPAAVVGIEGTQMAHAFGGYDLWRLSQVLDWVEPYDIGNAREILGSFMPGKPFMTTVFEKDAHHASRRLWHLLLEGDRGCIVWWSEDRIPWTGKGFELAAGAKAIAPVLAEMRSPLAALFLKAEPEHDPIHLHYSQASIQADWLIESTVDGSTWLRRFSSFESEHNRLAKVRDSWLKLFQDLGYSPRFLSSQQIVDGGLAASKAKVLVLPGSLALSASEAEKIRQFLSPSPDGVHHVFADDTPGCFDGHGRRRSLSPLGGYFPANDTTGAFRAVSSDGRKPAEPPPGDIAHYATDRLKSGGDATLVWAQSIPSLPPLEVSVPPERHTRIHRYRLGTNRLIALERNIDYHMSEELKQAGGNEALEKPVDVTVRLAQASHVYDLRTRRYLGRLENVPLVIDPWTPSLLLLAADKADGDRVVDSLGR